MNFYEFSHLISAQYKNEYHYRSKSRFVSIIDFLSSPIRSVLGGRNVNILSLTEDQEMTTAVKIATVVLLFIFWPLGGVSLASLLVKRWLWKWEKTEIHSQFMYTYDGFDKIINFNSEQSNDLESLIPYVLKDEPELFKNPDIYAALEKLNLFKTDPY